jgi:hypothetical protein
VSRDGQKGGAGRHWAPALYERKKVEVLFAHLKRGHANVTPLPRMNHTQLVKTVPNIDAASSSGYYPR